MLITSSSFDLSDTNSSKESIKRFKKGDLQAPIHLPRIKIEAEVIFHTPIVKIRERKSKSLDKNLEKPEKRKAIKVNDVTEVLSKDMPKTIIKNIVITPRRTSKIFASMDSAISYNPNKLLKKSRKSYRNREDFAKKHKNSTLEKIMKEIETNAEIGQFKNKKNGINPTRPISPWLYQGTSRRFSIFSNNN